MGGPECNPTLRQGAGLFFCRRELDSQPATLLDQPRGALVADIDREEG
jgi:hypothetical protein